MNHLTLAALTESSITNAIIWICCISLIFYLLYWLVGKLALPEPFSKIAYAVLAIAAVVTCIKILFHFAGNPF
jgi:magnesium-transporting ATPase (P-type)